MAAKRLKSAPALASCSDPPSYLTLKPGWDVPANIAVGIIRHRITATTDFIIYLLRKNIFADRLFASMCSRRRNKYGSKGKAVTPVMIEIHAIYMDIQSSRFIC